MKRRSFLGALAAIPLLAACGAESSPQNSAAGTSKITIGLVPVLHFAPVYLAIKEGFFKDAGLEADVQVIQNAASIVPSVINGQLTIGTAAGTPFINAVSKKLPVRAVSSAGLAPATPEEDAIALLVNADGGPATLADLAGKTVAINAQGSQPQIATMEVLKKAGLDPKSVKFVAMPMPEMLAALTQGRIDGAAVAEPFMTIGVNSGAKVLTKLYSLAFESSGPESVYFASQKVIESQRPMIDAFASAMNKANALANSDPKAIQAVMVADMGMDADLVSKLTLPIFGTALDADTLVKVSEVMVDTGFLTEAVPADKLILS